MEGPYNELDWENWRAGQRVVCRRKDSLQILEEGEKYIIRRISKSQNNISYNDLSNSAPLVFLEGKTLGYFIWRFKRTPKIIDEGEDE